MRYEADLSIRIVLALILLVVPTYVFGTDIFQTVFEEITFDTIYVFLEESGVEPKPGEFSVRYAITILGGEVTINIVKYCVTSSAYYLLSLLCIIVMGVSFWKRILMFLIGSALIFGMNIARIILLIIILLNNEGIFEPMHFMFSILLTLGYVSIVWVLLSFLFKVKTIPIYSDIKFLIKEILKRK